MDTDLLETLQLDACQMELGTQSLPCVLVRLMQTIIST